MAFPIPDHLPRRASPQDVSSKILSKIDQATSTTLNSALASSWLNELDETIQRTKERIHERIQADLPNFRRQLEASKSVQARLQSLSSHADSLCDAVSNPETGLVPSLLEEITRHVALAQEAANASSKYEALSCLLDCHRQFTTLNALVQAGQLPDAVAACNKLGALMSTAPSSLKEAAIMADLEGKFRASKNFTEDQLSDAYSRGIVFLPMELIITSVIQVRRSETVLPLTSILTSLSPQALSSHLATLRRDLMSHFVDHVLTQPTSVLITPSSPPGHKLTLIPAPPNTEIRSSRLDALSQILEFLSMHLLTCLPPHDRTSFSESLIKPLTNSLLNNLLIPSLPSSFGLLPPFLALLKRAVAFEEAFLSKTLGTNGNSQVIRSWADGVCGHYERQRRTNILAHARSVAIVPEDLDDKFQAEIDVALEPVQATIVAVQSNGESKDDSWGFDDDPDSATAEVENGWGFDDEEQTESLPERSAEEVVSLEPVDADGIEVSDPGEAWGWNDDDNLPPEEEIAEETAWDDPWAEPSPTEPEPEPASASAPITVSSPKAATRLEKLASKHKNDLNGHTTSLPTSPLPPQAIPPLSNLIQSSVTLNKMAEPAKRPANLMTTHSTKESYSVSKRTKQVLKIVEDVINEGQQFISSNLFATSETSSIPGAVIFQCASSALDLYNALYPVTFSKDLGTPERGLQFSNDCLYLCSQVEKIEQSISNKALQAVRERLSESSHHLKVLGDSWFDDAVEKERQTVDEVIVRGGQGFRYTTDQDRYDECESAMGQAVQEIRKFAQKVKKILPKSKYYIAMGSVVDAALSRILEDVLALPDIPEVESHRLSELCRIFNALEGLFSEDPEQPSFVVAYVPSWLKYSYLSELLEASMADITYLFEEGTLVDFEVDELVRLVRALFADTTLRTNTITKILEGHPVSW